MKLSYQHLVKKIPSEPSIEEISDRLFQLGHENEIDEEIIEIEITPNRGDCLSLDGILRDLNVFYSIDFKKDIYEAELKPITFEFKNLAVIKSLNIVKPKTPPIADIGPLVSSTP